MKFFIEQVINIICFSLLVAAFAAALVQASPSSVLTEYQLKLYQQRVEGD